MNKFDFTVPGRQSAIGILLFFALSARKFFKALWPILLVYLFKNNSIPEDKRFWIIVAGVFLLFLVMLNATLSFFNFWFYIENNEFVVRKGYLKKVKLSIPLDRIQTINIKQNLLQQLLKVVTVEVDTAGSAQRELKLVALTNEQAIALQLVLGKEKQQLNKLKSEDEEENSQDSEKSAPIIRLTPTDLIKVGISENHLRSSLIVMAVVGGFINQIQDYFTDQIEVTSEEVGNFIIAQSVAIIISLSIAVLLIGFLFSIINTFLKYYDFTFARQDGEFTIKSGLLTKKGVTIPYSKIQVVSWVTNPIRNWMDFSTVTLTEASSKENDQKKAINIPGCNSRNRAVISREIFNIKDEPVWDKHFTHKSYAWKLWLLRGWLIAMPPAIIWYDNIIVLSVAAFWIVLNLPLSFLTLKKRYFRVNKDYIENSRGTIEQKWSRMYGFKVQSVKLKQSIFQRRKGLATIKLYTAGGKILTMPFIAESLARELYNYLLFNVESGNRKWM